MIFSCSQSTHRYTFFQAHNQHQKHATSLYFIGFLLFSLPELLDYESSSRLGFGHEAPTQPYILVQDYFSRIESNDPKLAITVYKDFHHASDCLIK